MRLIDADALRAQMYHDAFETDSDMQKWDSGCWIRYKMFENAIENAPTIEPERKKGKCPICKYPFEDCQCRFAGSAHPDRSKRARVVADHIYLLTDAQIEHLKKVQEWWQTSYDDEEMNRILNELRGEDEE